MTRSSTESAAVQAPADGRDELLRGLLGALIAVSAWSTGTILAKAIEMGSLAIGSYRFLMFGLAAVLLAVLMAGERTDEAVPDA